MIINYSTYFIIGLIIMTLLITFLSPIYKQDIPDSRKKHKKPISQIGGLIIGLFLFILFLFNNEAMPLWFFIGGGISLLLGILDDNFKLNWKIKLFIQLGIMSFIIYSFWGQFNQIIFYNYTLEVSQISLLAIFAIWFIGIYNAVNLIDGIDGLAAGFVFIITITIQIISNGLYISFTIPLLIILLVFLTLNQRPAKIFMGDAGSLLFGFYIAVLPLLFYNSTTKLAVLDMTPYLILSSFLIADTSRVFLTRLMNGKNPMNADTIHFHHLVIQRSGSYLVTLSTIYLFVIISAIIAILNNFYNFNQMGMLVHLSLLFLFILTPPAPTYVSFISRFVGPAYLWDNQDKDNSSKWQQTLIISILLLILLFLMIYNNAFNIEFFIGLIISTILVTIYFFMCKEKVLFIPVIQVFLYILFFEIGFSFEIGFFIKLFVLLSIISLIIFTFQRLAGTILNQLSALDLIVFFITLGAILLSCFSVTINISTWLLLYLFSIWFMSGFILRRLSVFKN